MKQEKKLKDVVNKISHRAELLPLLFTMKGTPYSLDDYPPFKELYKAETPPTILYMCGRQIGKTTNLARSEILDCIQINHFQLLYVAPLQSQAQRYSVLQLRPAIRECKLAVALQQPSAASSLDTEIIKTVNHQSFRNGSGVQLTYAKTSSDRARGVYADRIDYDEVQDQLIDSISIISQSVSNSPFGLIRYTGTAKTVDNTIEGLWRSSTQSEWTIKCEHCGHWNQPTLENDVFSMIQVKGLCCSKCGKQINPRDGLFVDANELKFGVIQGYHIPQIVIPAIVEDRRKWLTVVDKAINSPKPTVLQEILGISADQGARLLTEEAIDKATILPTVKELKANLGKYIKIIMGIDWGIAEQESFTVPTIIGVLPDGYIDTLYATRLLGGDPMKIMTKIVQLFKEYRCNLVAADMGAGFVYNSMLQLNASLPLVGIQYTSQNQFLTYNPLFGRTRWVIDRVSAITMTFLSIIGGRIRFPKELMVTFKSDLLSPYEHIIETGAGQSVKRILRTPGKPDDFTHALTFAFVVAAKLVFGTDLTAVPAENLAAENVANAVNNTDFWDIE